MKVNKQKNVRTSVQKQLNRTEKYLHLKPNQGIKDAHNGIEEIKSLLKTDNVPK